MQKLRENPRLMRLVIIGVVSVLVVCVVGVLAFRILTSGGDEVAQQPLPQVVQVTEEATLEVEVAPTEEQATPTATLVIPETTAEPTKEASPTPIPTATTSKDDTASSFTTTGAVDDMLNNGGFEVGFDDTGVATGWQSFKNDSVVVTFSSEKEIPYIKSGASAQRITISQASQPDRYAGIYQQVKVVPNQEYTLALNGQIRSPVGDENASSYGYQMQYAIDQTGNTNWQNVPQDKWINLPWGEQLLYSSEVSFLSYNTPIIPISDQITIFIRAWNKWADVGETQYTLDGISLIGPSVSAVASVPIREQVQPTPIPEIAVVPSVVEPTVQPGGDVFVEPTVIIKNGLPLTGADSSSSGSGSGTIWAGLFVLVLLVVGAVSRGKWG